MTLRERIADLAFRTGIETTGRGAYRRLIESAGDPHGAQARALARILRSLAATELGREFGDADIDEFRRRVPVHDYEKLRPHIERQIATGLAVVTPTRPIMYARTSGTTGKPKLIPVTTEVAADLAAAQSVFSYVQHRELDAFRGPVLAIGGAVREETLPDGTPAGAATGLIYETMPALIRAKYVVPPAVFGIEDYALRYAVIARLAVQHRDLSMIGTANPSTILRLLEQIRSDAPALEEDLVRGDSRLLKALPATLARRVRAALKPDRAQARVLASARASGAPITLETLWPELRAVMTWLGAGCAGAAAQVRALLPADARAIDAGYVASEVRGTVVVDAARNLALPLLEHVFFEFAPVDAWDSGDRATLLLTEIEEGRTYYVLVTTAGGLVRYDMQDVVRVTGRIGRTPTLEFVRKGRGVTNLTGEKLTEEQVNLAVITAATRAALTVPFHVVVADAATNRYVAYVETPAQAARRDELASAIDSELAALNIEYAGKRASGRLRPLALVVLAPGTGHAYREHAVRKGQRESQFKVLSLQSAAEVDFDFASFAVDRRPHEG
jgi:hypothetical protein